MSGVTKGLKSLTQIGCTHLGVFEHVLAHRGYVMDSGLITMTGVGKDMLEDPKVRAAYLGE